MKLYQINYSTDSEVETRSIHFLNGSLGMVITGATHDFILLETGSTCLGLLSAAIILIAGIFSRKTGVVFGSILEIQQRISSTCSPSGKGLLAEGK